MTNPERRSPALVALAALVLIGGVIVGARPIGPAPALGPVLDPAHGVWALASAGELRRGAHETIPGLGATVRVVYDDRAVPHIFAASVEDAVRALGYVVARDRLAQLHIQTLGAAGRITEVAGARALELDREMRRLGLPRAAERALATLDDSTHRFLDAYADGVNAYIGAMPAGALPVEFRLTGAAPARWRPLDTILLLERMGWTLAYLFPEGQRAAAASRVGREAAAALFPEAQPIVEPIQPNGQRAPRVDPLRLPPPGTPDTGLASLVSLIDRVQRAVGGSTLDDDSPRHFASNNWAVSPRRTAAGRALLAGDPHLDLTLPSIWYEAHLVVPGVMDVHGVTIPGAPGIIIGFNRDIAWTFTNTGADVLDFYQEQVDSVDAPTKYRVDGSWRPLERRVETYRGKNGAAIAVDTMYFTHRGPMQRQGDRWLSMRWTVHDSGSSVLGFLAAARARSVDEFQAGMVRHFRAPAQNMLVADRTGSIAIRSTGCFPVRPGEGGGMVIRDGSTSASDWTGCIPVERWPQAKNPAQGFLASANQQPIDPRATRDYWGGDYDPWRALRINRLLREDSAVTPETMRRWQTDPGSERAAMILPHLLRAGQRSANTNAREAARLLAQWDGRYTRENSRAVLFENTMTQIIRRTWDELLVDPSDDGRRVANPATAILVGLLADSASVWWDDRRTPVRESRDAIIAASLDAALEATRRERGEPDAGGWTWSKVRHANIRHLLQLPDFSALEVPVQSGPGTLAPSTGRGGHGPSWRMVVELGPEVRAWGTYPGGQSGDPASPRYLNRLPLWRDGQLEPLFSPRTERDIPAARNAGTLVLEPGSKSP